MPQPWPPGRPRGLPPSSGRQDRNCRKRRGAGGRRRKKTQAAMREGAASATRRERSCRCPDAGEATRRPGDPATRRPGDPATRRPGDPATRRPGDPATRRPGDPATRRPGDPANYSGNLNRPCQPQNAGRRGCRPRHRLGSTHKSHHRLSNPGVRPRRMPQCKRPREAHVSLLRSIANLPSREKALLKRESDCNEATQAVRHLFVHGASLRRAPIVHLGSTVFANLDRPGAGEEGPPPARPSCSHVSSPSDPESPLECSTAPPGSPFIVLRKRPTIEVAPSGRAG